MTCGAGTTDDRWLDLMTSDLWVWDPNIIEHRPPSQVTEKLSIESPDSPDPSPLGLQLRHSMPAMWIAAFGQGHCLLCWMQKAAHLSLQAPGPFLIKGKKVSLFHACLDDFMASIFDLTAGRQNSVTLVYKHLGALGWIWSSWMLGRYFSTAARCFGSGSLRPHITSRLNLAILNTTPGASTPEKAVLYVLKSLAYCLLMYAMASSARPVAWAARENWNSEYLGAAVSGCLWGHLRPIEPIETQNKPNKSSTSLS